MSEITVASTTDTDQAIQEAAGIPEADQPETATEPAEEKHETKEEAGKQPETHSKSAVQKRFDQLTREKYDAQRKNEEFQARIEALEKSIQAKAQPEGETVVEQAPAPDTTLRAKPTRQDVNVDGTLKYATDDVFIEDLADWKYEERESKRLAQESQNQQRVEHEKTVNTYNQNLVEFKKEHPDFDSLVSASIRVPQLAVEAVVKSGDPAIAYYLGQHPEICDELTKKANDPLFVALKIGEIRGQVATRVSREHEAEAEEVEVDRAMPKARKASRAPAPITPLGGSPTASSVTADEMSFQDYKRMRERQIKAKYSR